MHAVRDGVTSLRDHDFSISIARVANQELGELATAYNELGELLRRERLDLYQRELLLDTVIQTTPQVMVLTNSVGRVVYSNVEARQLFNDGRKLEGLDFATLLSGTPSPLREALSDAANTTGDSLFTIDVGGESQVYHLSQRHFHLNAQGHRLILLKQLTRELAAQEVAVWKKVIRVIAHELNNSLAPIASLVHSGRLLSQDLAGREAPQLERIFTTIGDRTAHLTSFIDGYARFAKLPQPQLTAVSWPDFLNRLEGTMPFRVQGALPQRPANIDVGQLEQVMINLLKNAAESGSAPQDITVAVREAQDAGQGSGFVLEVADRGSGLKDHVLRDALLPFYSTKPAGTGLGLTLCREIVEAHEGRLTIANRDGGGALVTLWLPSG
jgi:two-component system nitrogen regulation sensor histidine kinase NtrY